MTFLVIEQKSTNQKNTFKDWRFLFPLILMLQSIMIVNEDPFVNYDKSFGQLEIILAKLILYYLAVEMILFQSGVVMMQYLLKDKPTKR